MLDHRLVGSYHERMCRALYAYRFGNIGFLELLDKFEEILGIESSYGMTEPDGKEDNIS